MEVWWCRDGVELDIQRRVIQAWCKANDHKLVPILSDGGISGA